MATNREEFRAAVVAAIADMSNAEQFPSAITELAIILQEELYSKRGHELKYSGDLDLIMRGVVAYLRSGDVEFGLKEIDRGRLILAKSTN